MQEFVDLGFRERFLGVSSWSVISGIFPRFRGSEILWVWMNFQGWLLQKEPGHRE